MSKQSQITHWCHEIIRSPGGSRGFTLTQLWEGNDTRFFCELAGEEDIFLHLTFKKRHWKQLRSC